MQKGFQARKIQVCSEHGNSRTVLQTVPVANRSWRTPPRKMEPIGNQSPGWRMYKKGGNRQETCLSSPGKYMGLIFKDPDHQPADQKTIRQRTMLLSLPFAIVGVLALVFLVHDEIGSGFAMKRQMATGLLSVAAVCGGLIALIFGISSKKQALI